MIRPEIEVIKLVDVITASTSQPATSTSRQVELPEEPID